MEDVLRNVADEDEEERLEVLALDSIDAKLRKPFVLLRRMAHSLRAMSERLPGRATGKSEVEALPLLLRERVRRMWGTVSPPLLRSKASSFKAL